MVIVVSTKGVCGCSNLGGSVCGCSGLGGSVCGCLGSGKATIGAMIPHIFLFSLTSPPKGNFW